MCLQPSAGDINVFGVIIYLVYFVAVFYYLL